MPSPATAIGPGSTLDRYEILGEIASGGMATVYLARAVAGGGFERTVAVKVCHAHLRSDEEFVTMFFDEARLAAKIHHPNVVPVLDVQDRDALFLVMEYIEGDRLAELVREARRRETHLPVGVALRIMIDALAGLHAAHESREASGAPLHIVHRDVSPQNILVGHDGVARLTDFGIAKAAARATVTREGHMKGKFAYMAPEHVAGEPIDRRADIFSAGVVLWEALTARRLFRADSEVETMNLVLRGPIAKPSTIVSGIPRELDQAVERALARDPEHRFQTAADLGEALETCGVTLAHARAVNECLMDLAGERVTARRRLLAEDARRASNTTPTSRRARAADAATPAGTADVPRDAGTPVDTVSAQTLGSRAARGRRFRTRVASAVAVGVLAVGVLVVWRIGVRSPGATAAPRIAATVASIPAERPSTSATQPITPPTLVRAPDPVADAATTLADTTDAAIAAPHAHRHESHREPSASELETPGATTPTGRFEPGAI